MSAANPMSEPNPMLEAALQYTRRGWSVIAVHSIRDGACTCGKIDCASPAKHPIGGWKGRQRSRATEAEIESQWQRTPWANVGIVTGEISGLLVLDIDDIAKLDQAADVRAAVLSIITPVAITGREGGGVHIYFRHPGGQLGNFAKHVEGMDGRGDGGFVVAPPSIHASGKQYRWASEAYDGTTALAETPEAVLRLFGGGSAPTLLTETSDGFTAYGRKALDDELAAVRSTSEGGRNDRLNRAAFSIGQLVQRRDLPLSVAERELVAAGVDTGLSETAAMATVRSGLEGGASKPRSLVTSNRAMVPAIGGAGSAGASAFQPLNIGIVDSARVAPVRFPLEVFGARWSSWVAGGAEQRSVPVDYVAGSLLVVAGSLIGNARRVSPWEGWVEPAHIWGMLIGEPSAGKTPGMKPVLELLSPLEAERERRHTEAMTVHAEKVAAAKATEEQWKADCKAAKKDSTNEPPRPALANPPPEPVCQQIVVNDATMEKLGLIAQANPKGVLFFRDEIAGWLNDFGRYGGDGDRQRWLEAYNGDRQRIDRVKHPLPIIIKHFSVGVLGGMQPERLGNVIVKEIDDGLGARFLYVWPDPLPPRRPRKRTDDAIARLAFSKLDALQTFRDERGAEGPAIIQLAVDAADRFEAWRLVHDRDKPNGLLLKGHFGKMPGLVLRLALVIEYLRWAADDTEGQAGSTFGDTIAAVSLASLEGAIALIDTYFKPMARRVFAESEIPPGDRLATQLARWIKRARPLRFNARQVRAAGDGPGIREAKAMSEACQALQDYGWIRFSGSRADGQPGRQSSDWEVNPALWDALTANSSIGSDSCAD